MSTTFTEPTKAWRGTHPEGTTHVIHHNDRNAARKMFAEMFGLSQKQVKFVRSPGDDWEPPFADDPSLNGTHDEEASTLVPNLGHTSSDLGLPTVDGVPIPSDIKVYPSKVVGDPTNPNTPLLEWASNGQRGNGLEWTALLPHGYVLRVSGSANLWSWTCEDATGMTRAQSGVRANTDDGGPLTMSGGKHETYPTSYNARVGAERWAKKNLPEAWAALLANAGL